MDRYYPVCNTVVYTQPLQSLMAENNIRDKSNGITLTAMRTIVHPTGRSSVCRLSLKNKCANINSETRKLLSAGSVKSFSHNLALALRGVPEMLWKLNYATAAVGWMLTRLQAEAFSVVGFQKLSNPKHVAALPSPASTSSTPRTSATSAWRPPSLGFLPLHMSTGGDAVESSLGTTSEERSVLDALIDQFTSPKSGNVTATVEEYLDLCDHAFLTHLRRRIEAEETPPPTVRA